MNTHNNTSRVELHWFLQNILWQSKVSAPELSFQGACLCNPGQDGCGAFRTREALRILLGSLLTWRLPLCQGLSTVLLATATASLPSAVMATDGK